MIVHSMYEHIHHSNFTTGLISRFDYLEILNGFTSSYALPAFVVYVVFSLFATFVLYKYEDSKIALICAWVAGWSISLTPLFLPWKAVRFFCGLQVFTSSMSIHGRVCGKLQPVKISSSIDDIQGLAAKQSEQEKKEKAQPSSSPTTFQQIPCSSSTSSSSLSLSTSSSSSHTSSSSSGTLSLAKHPEEATFKEHFLRTYFYNLHPKLRKKSAQLTFPSVGRIVYFLYVCMYYDICLWCMEELIPYYITNSSNAYIVKAFVAGIWVLHAMDLAYNNAIIFLNLEGSPLTYDMRHRHPLLSTSLTEFWGSRWNPIIGKLLQEAFYKPTRRMGLSRVVAMITCFVGSAILHAFPQYLSTFSLSDSIMMFSFFFIHGILVLIEQIFHNSNLRIYYSEESAHQVPTNAHYQWASEMITTSWFLLVVYYCVETEMGHKEISNIVALGTIMFTCVYLLYVTTPDEIPRSQSGRIGISIGGFGGKRKKSRDAYMILLGWFWTVTCVIGTLPLFSMPVYNSCNSFYSRSFVVGPVMRVMHRWISNQQ